MTSYWLSLIKEGLIITSTNTLFLVSSVDSTYIHSAFVHDFLEWTSRCGVHYFFGLSPPPINQSVWGRTPGLVGITIFLVIWIVFY